MGEKFRVNIVDEDMVEFNLNDHEWRVGVDLEEYPGCCGATCIHSLGVQGRKKVKTKARRSYIAEYDTFEEKEAVLYLRNHLTNEQKREVFEKLFEAIVLGDSSCRLYSLTTVMPGGVRNQSSVNYSGDAPHVEGFSLYEFARANGFRKSGECKSGTTKNQIALFTKSLDWD